MTFGFTPAKLSGPATNCHDDRARLGAAWARTAEVMALASGDGTDNEPDDQQGCSNSHCFSGCGEMASACSACHADCMERCRSRTDWICASIRSSTWPAARSIEARGPSTNIAWISFQRPSAVSVMPVRSDSGTDSGTVKATDTSDARRACGLPPGPSALPSASGVKAGQPEVRPSRAHWSVSGSARQPRWPGRSAAPSVQLIGPRSRAR